MTGDAPEQGDYPGTGAVYDLDAIGLVELMTRLNGGVDFHGRAIDAPTSFFPGVAVNPTADDLELEAERFRRKVEAGARFAMTQIVFDLGYLERFLDRIGGSPIPLLVGVWPIRSTMNSRCGSRSRLRCPPILAGATDPVARYRCDHFTADDTATPNRAATERQL